MLQPVVLWVLAISMVQPCIEAGGGYWAEGPFGIRTTKLRGSIVNSGVILAVMAVYDYSYGCDGTGGPTVS